MKRERVIISIAILVFFLQMGFGQYQQQGIDNPLIVDQPRTYLEVGELLTVEATSDEERDHAAQVLALGALIAHQNGDMQLAASCCIALSSSTNIQEQQRDLWDLALSIDPGRFNGWVRYRAQANRSSVARNLADCLRLLRNAEYEEAGEIFRSGLVQSRLRETASSLGYQPESLTHRIEALLAMGTDDDCKGRVFVTRVRDGESKRHLCNDHNHPIGTVPDVQTLNMLLSIELECMESARQLEDWGGVAAMSLDQPLRIPDIQSLQRRYSVDLDRPYWDGTGWSARP